MPAPMAPWRPTLGLLDPFRTEMEDLMHRFFGEEAGNGHPARAWAPRVDLEETEKEIVVRADVPGVDPKDVEVAVADGVLTVRGERKEEKTEKKKSYHRTERFVGSFYRAVTLPPGADPEKMAATSANGVVTVTIPKKAEAQPRRITVTPKG